VTRWLCDQIAQNVAQKHFFQKHFFGGNKYPKIYTTFVIFKI
jgi:hypothetical protein